VTKRVVTTFLELLLLLAVVWFVWRFLNSIFNPHQPAEPIEDPFAGVRAPRRRGPKGQAGAVALAEPDEDTEDDADTPRNM
jgi:hypothetical protein